MKFASSLLVLVLVVSAIGAVQPVTAREYEANLDRQSLPVSASAKENDSFWMHWTTPVNVSQTPSDEATWPSLGVSDDGQSVYLAWSDGRSDPKDIYYAHSANGGDTWGSAQRVAQTGSESLRPSIAVSGATPFYAWADRTLWPHHTTFEMPLGGSSPTIVPNGRTALAYAPRLAPGPGGELHMALQGGTVAQPDILYTRRAAGATAWPEATVVFTHIASGSSNPSLAVSADGQTVHLVWQENLSGNESTIYYLRGQWNGQGMQWGTPLSLSDGVPTSVRPAIALGTGSVVHVVWGEKAPDVKTQYIRYSRSADGGTNWSTPRRIDPDPFSVNSLSPTDIAPAIVAVSSDDVCVGWHGFRVGAGIEAEEIHVTCSNDDGASWASAVNVSHSETTISTRPVLAVADDGILHLAWQEYVGPSATENYQVYYAHSVPYVVFLPVSIRNG